MATDYCAGIETDLTDSGSGRTRIDESHCSCHVAELKRLVEALEKLGAHHANCVNERDKRIDEQASEVARLRGIIAGEINGNYILDYRTSLTKS